MATTNILHIFVRGWKLLCLCTFLGLAVALGVSLLMPLKYSSSVRLLITQTNVTGVDPYTAIKSTERIGQNLTELAYSSSFFNAVMNQGGIDRSYFPTDEIDKRKEWRDSLDIGVEPNTGIMSVTAYHKDRSQAQAIAIAVAQEIAVQAPNYYGYSVRAQVIDDPLPSRFFAKPDFLQNGALGLAFGFLIGAAWILSRMREIR